MVYDNSWSDVAQAGGGGFTEDNALNLAVSIACLISETVWLEVCDLLYETNETKPIPAVIDMIAKTARSSIKVKPRTED